MRFVVVMGTIWNIRWNLPDVCEYSMFFTCPGVNLLHFPKGVSQTYWNRIFEWMSFVRCVSKFSMRYGFLFVSLSGTGVLSDSCFVFIARLDTSLDVETSINQTCFGETTFLHKSSSYLITYWLCVLLILLSATRNSFSLQWSRLETGYFTFHKI